MPAPPQTMGGAPPGGMMMPGNPGAPPPPPTGMGAPQPPGFGATAQAPMSAGGFNTPAPPMYGGFDQGANAIIDQFTQLTMGAGGPGQATDVGIDPNAFPRPLGEDAKVVTEGGEPICPGSCDPRFMRLTTNAIPNSSSLRTRWALPLGAVIQPLADIGTPVPVVNFGASGIVRCRRCRTYINAFVQFTDGGRRWRCNVCGMLNDVPVDYFCTLDADGRRRDIADRPELCQGAVEYVAPAEYMVRPPMPPCFFFVIDVSAQAVASGMVQVAVDGIKASLDNLPGAERTLVGLLTFDSALHFYSLKSTLTQPQMMVVSDLDDPFLPMGADDLLVNLRESRAVLDTLLSSLPSMVASTQNIDSCTGAAVQAAYMVMSHIGGKMVLFQGSMASMGPGRLKNRDNPAAYGTDREHHLRTPEDPFYKKMAAECSRVQIAVDVYATSGQYQDLASLTTLPKYTSGKVYYYPAFSAARDGQKLHAEVCKNLGQTLGWEAVMRVRCGKGLRISTFHGHFFIRSTDLLALPCVDKDMTHAVQITHEETLVTTNVTYVQCALLYTSSCGERRIRVLTLQVPVVNELQELYKAADTRGITALMAKLAVEKTLSSRLEDARQAILSKTTGVLKEFRNMYATQLRAHNKLVFPDSLKLLPLYMLGLTKCAALRGGAKDLTADERSAIMFDLMSLGVKETQILLYPSMYMLHNMPAECGKAGEGAMMMPAATAMDTSRVDPEGAYLIDNGRVLVLYLGRAAPTAFLQGVFGVGPEVPADQLALEPARAGSDLSVRVNAIVASLRKGRMLHQAVHVVRQGEPSEAHIMPYFVEDRGQGTMGYVDWLVQLHRGVQQKM